MTDEAPSAYTVAHEGGVWASTEDGPIHVEQGSTLPDAVLPSEITRLANGGTLEGFDVVDVEADELPELANLDELRLRVGDDAATARRYLDQENTREAPRKTWISHLEGVIAADQPEQPEGSEDLGGVGIVDDEGGA